MHKKLQINDKLIAFTTRLSTINTLSKSSILQITFKPLKKIHDIPLLITFIKSPSQCLALDEVDEDDV